MIALLEGRIASTHADHLVIVVNGVGYRVSVPATLIGLEGEDITLHTSLVVREDLLSLHGFTTPGDRDLFELLLTCSGVGPRLAMAILGTLNADNLRSAVVGDRAEILTRVPGIGKKLAQKLLLELKDKLPRGLDAVPMTAFDDVNSDVIDALVALGFSIIEAQSAIQALPADAPRDVDERIKKALQYFG
jgi:Holliday junction DNA helicase RuvA